MTNVVLWAMAIMLVVNAVFWFWWQAPAPTLSESIRKVLSDR